ncbi:unnamed protein product [Cercospora beticola]|nr:unnamed protein product [Cercospora beticola]
MAPERPSPYRSRYLLYKKGSQQVVNWLHKTARGLGGHSKSLDKLCVDDLPSLALTINNAKIELPKNIASTLSDVIYLRQKAHEWYSSLARDDFVGGDDRIGDFNKSHRYFIEKLKVVRATLDPTGAKASKHDALHQQQQQQGASAPDISNMFANLDLEEPCDGAPNSATGSATKPESSNMTPDVLAGEPGDERPFKIWCMLQDVRDIRVFVRELWRRYYDGDFTFPTAAYVTDMAFRAVSDIVSANADKALRHYAAIVVLMDLKIGQSTDGIVSFSSTIDEGANGLDAADLYCAPAFCILQEFLISCQVDHAADSPQSEARYFRRHPLAVALRGLQSQLKLLAGTHYESGYLGPLALDQFTYNILSICKYGVIRTATVVQCQMYLDVYDALGQQTTSVTSMLRPVAASVDKTFDDYAQTRSPRFQACIEKDSKYLRELTKISREDRFPGAQLRDACKPSSLFAVLPVLAGTYLHELLRHATSHSIRCVNSSFETIGAAYLYAAMKGTPKWEAMDLLLDQHQSYAPQASSLYKLTRNFEQAVGANKMACRRPAGKGLPNSAAAARTLLDFPYFEQAVVLNTEKIQESEKPDQFPGMLYEAVRLHRGKSLTSRASSKSSVDLLSAFAEVLIEDEGKLRINYLALSARCQSLLNVITYGFRSHLQDLLANSNSAGLSHQNVVHAILREASDSASAHSSNAANRTSTTILEELDLYFETFIELEGRVGMSATPFGNCIMNQNKPCDRWTWGGDDRPGYIKGKKIFGPETFLDCEIRKAEQTAEAVCRLAVQQWDFERCKGTEGTLMEQKLQEIESWGNSEFLKAGIAVKLRRLQYSSNGDYLGFQPVFCQEAFDLLNKEE